MFKTVLDGEARGVFQGKIIVRPEAQKTDARMATHALLLSDTAEADNKPELEIFADDVQCGHGATSGDLDEDLLFYLKARGIPAEGGGVAADPGLRRRGGGRHRACRAARRADGSRRRLAEGARRMKMHVSMHAAGPQDPQPASAGSRERTTFAARRVCAEGAMTHPAVSNGAYDVARIRKDFPILAMQVYGKPLVYLDNAASAQKPQVGARPHPGGLHLANTPTCIAACTISPMPRPRPTRARARRCAAFSMPSRSEEIIFTRNATEAINLVAATFGRDRIEPGDEIVLSIMEHHSNIVPWHFLRERHGAVIKWAPVDDEGNFLHRRVREAADAAHQDGRDHPYVEHARHAGAGEGGGAALRMRAAFRCWSMARRPPCISTSTCRTSAAISTR